MSEKVKERVVNNVDERSVKQDVATTETKKPKKAKKVNPNTKALDNLKEANRSKQKEVLTIDGNKKSIDTKEYRLLKEYRKFQDSMNKGTILKGVVSNIQNHKANGRDWYALVVMTADGFKVIIPTVWVSPLTDEFTGTHEEQDQQYRVFLNNFLGAEIEYIITQVDLEERFAIASRIDAMTAKSNKYYKAKGDQPPIIEEGDKVQARVIYPYRYGMLVEVFGVDTFIKIRDISYNWINDAADLYKKRDVVTVVVTEVKETKLDSGESRFAVQVSPKLATENPQKEAFERYDLGSDYIGVVSAIQQIGIFVSLGDTQVLCVIPKNGAPMPRVGSDVTVRITRKQEENFFLNGQIRETY